MKKLLPLISFIFLLIFTITFGSAQTKRSVSPKPTPLPTTTPEPVSSPFVVKVPTVLKNELLGIETTFSDQNFK